MLADVFLHVAAVELCGSWLPPAEMSGAMSGTWLTPAKVSGAMSGAWLTPAEMSGGMSGIAAFSDSAS